MSGPASPTSPPRRIAGGIGVSTGDVACDGDLTVEGNVLDGRQVRAGGTIDVAGAIQAATVSAGGDLRAAGGITGRGKAECRAVGAVTARYIVKASVVAGGTIRVDTEILAATVAAGGDVLMEAGSIIAGSVVACGEIRCRKIGSTGGVDTFIAAGVDQALEAAVASSLPEIESKRARAVKIRDIVAPLLRNQRALNAAQKEKATELLFEADELDATAAKSLGELHARIKGLASRPNPRIHVAELIGSGTHLRVRDLETTIESAVEGPVSIVARGSGSQRRLLAVDVEGKEVELKSRPVQNACMQMLARLRPPPSATASASLAA